MPWQSPVSYGRGEDTGEDLDAFLESLVDFDGRQFELPPYYANAPVGQSDDADADADDAKVLTIMTSIHAIHQHLENERQRGHGRGNVVIKLKDMATRKSISFSIPELHSPTTTAASSSSSRSGTPSPETSAVELGGSRISRDGTADTIITTPAGGEGEGQEDVLSSGEHLLATHQRRAPTIDPLLEAASLTKATEASSGLISPVTPDEDAILRTDHYRRAPIPACAVASPVEMAEDMPSYTVSLRPTRARQAALAAQAPSAMPYEEKKDSIAASRISSKNGSSNHHQKRPSLTSTSHRSIKRPRGETSDLAALLPNEEEQRRVHELTAGQDSSLIYKMVRNARALLPPSAAEEGMPHHHSADMDADAAIHWQNGQHCSPKQEDVVQRFCTTVRQIEWVERLAFQSMVQYRVLFVQLYQQYITLQKLVVTKKGERRVTLAKEQLYRTLYPQVEKTNGNGQSSDEWERFNRCIRRGKQWNTIASELGVGILQRMPSSINHSWVEQKLQTKEQLYIWIEILRLLG